ncbi:hypothetical protein CU097_007018, partial [Rhizopus azygosporus]
MSSSTITNPYITENWLHMKQDHDYLKVETKKQQQQDAKRNSRHILETIEAEKQKALMQRRKSSLLQQQQQQQQTPRLRTKKSNELLVPRRQSTATAKEGTGLITFADRFRDTLAVGRKQELAKLGIYTSPQEKKPVKTRVSTITSPQPKNNNVVEIINNAKRRSSTTKEKILQQQQPRRRTLSSGSVLQERTKLTPTYMKSTVAADQQRRHSVANTLANRASPRRKNSIKSAEDEVEAVRRKSILAAATLKARQLNTENRSTSSTSTGSGGEEKKTIKKKVDPTETLATRRMSRTESLKEGLPTSPSMAAKVTRRKSIIKQQQEDTQQAKKTTTTPTTPSTRTVRKRGKTLPGSLAKPPAVQSVHLPPMKVEPIKLNLPKTTKRNSLLPKSPSMKAANTSTNRLSCSNKTTPIPNSSCSSSSSSAGETVPKKTLSTRKLKGQSHLGISTSRRASMKQPATASIVTPPLKSSPISAASPRVRPESGRRQSLAETKRSHTTEIDYPRKSSTSAYSTNSRKNSLADESNTIAAPINQQGRNPRIVSLLEKLEAMVAEHAIDEDITTNGTRIRKSQSYANEIDLLSDTRPQRIKDTLMKWDKEMVEAFSPGVPKSPQIAIKFYGHHLSPYEQSEIHNYSEIYFLGQHAKKYQAMPDNPAMNYGYDDERGDYKSVVSDHLAYRYEILEELGRGSFGQVVKCLDHKTNMTVAVKLIRNKKRFYAQAKTEVKILSDLIKWDPEDRHHNVKMTDHFYFRNHLCIACECLSMNLYEFIKINNFQGFHIPLIKRFTVQLLRSLSLLAKHGVIHCDLKPENILLKHPSKSTIKVIDFGSSCLESERVYTYIQSRFYRSPEIILGLDYTKAIDMWSLGCIIAELYTGIPLFPGENEQEQLACIMEVLGVPDMELIQLSERRHLFFDRRGEPRV